VRVVRPPTRVGLGIVAAVLVPLIASAQTGKIDVPYAPTPELVVNRMLDLAAVKPDEFVIDLGSGDGRIPIAAAKRHKARALGVDINPVMVAEATENAAVAGVADRVTFRVENLFQTDISKADVLTMYLFDTINRRLRPRILKDMRPGTRVVSHGYGMGEWEADVRDPASGNWVYLWVVPAGIGGRWRMTAGKQAIMLLDIKQRFQTFEGNASIDGRGSALQNGRIRGDKISFMVDGQIYRGTVRGNAIEGEGGAARAAPWRATRAAN
jgi:SAM-dependent methyltransferase